MKQLEDYPALYIAADEASNKAQASLTFNYKLNIFFLIGGAFASLISTFTGLSGPVKVFIAIISASFFIASLASFIYAKDKNFHKTWYEARALAESIKTATWKLVFSAEPFSNAVAETNLDGFRRLLTELLQENRGMGVHLAQVNPQQQQITPTMLNVIRMTFDEKKQYYLENRIKEQLKWYTKKSGDNRIASARYFHYLCAAYAVAIILLLIRISFPDADFLPIDLFAVIASCILGWMQIKRFDELASAYGLTAHEIGIIESRFASVINEAHLSNFVGDAENAFSREHTQWAARRDH